MPQTQRSILPLVVGLAVAAGAVGLALVGVGGGDSAGGAADDGGGEVPVALLVGIAVSVVATAVLVRLLVRRSVGPVPWRRGSAVITALRETAERVDDKRVSELRLEVTVPDRDPFATTVRTVVPAEARRGVSEGARLPIEVAVGQGGALEVSVDWPSFVRGASDQVTTVDTDRFLMWAVPATGTILAVTPTGMTVANPTSGRHSDAIELRVRVARDSQEPYEASVIQGVPDDVKHLAQPGSVVPVGVHREDPSDIAIDWGRAEAER